MRDTRAVPGKAGELVRLPGGTCRTPLDDRDAGGGGPAHAPWDLGGAVLCHGLAMVAARTRVLAVSTDGCGADADGGLHRCGSRPLARCAHAWRSEALHGGDSFSRRDAPGAAGGDGTRQPPAAVCDTSPARLLFVPTRHSMLALNVTDGSVAWRRALLPSGAPRAGDWPLYAFAPALCGRRVFATVASRLDGTASVFALDADTGDVVWQQALPPLDAGRGAAVSAAATHPTVSAGCDSVYVATSAGVYRLDGVTGAIDTSQAALGLCGAVSLALIDGGGAAGRDVVITAASNAGDAYGNASMPCAAERGIMALEVAPPGGNSSATVAWRNTGANSTAFADVDVVTSADGNVFCCQGGALYAATPEPNNGTIAAHFQDFVGCTGVVVADNGQLLVRTTDGLRLMEATDDPPTPAPPSVTTPPPTSAAATSASAATSAPHTTAFNPEQYCGDRITACMHHYCPSVADLLFSNETCYGEKCLVYCATEHASDADCFGLMPFLCAPAKVVDQPCNAKCDGDYSSLFGGQPPEPEPAPGPEPAPRAPAPAPTSASPATSAGIAPVPAPGAGGSWWIGAVIGVAVVLVALAVGAYLYVQRRKNMNRYVLLELDDDDDAEDQRLLG